MKYAAYSAALVLAAIATLLVLGSDETGSPAEKDRPNIVFVLVDALRRDHVSCYGYSRKTTPVMDGLAQDGLKFENAVSQSPWTTASVASIMTSMYPSQVGVHAIEGPAKERALLTYSVTSLGAEAATLVELLHDNGYFTACVTTNWFASGLFGFLQGYDRYTEIRMDACEAVDTAVRQISNRPYSYVGARRRPFFLYIHLMDAHFPTDPPPPFDSKYPTPDSAAHEERHTGWDYLGADHGPEAAGFEEFKSHKLALYDGALSFADAELGRLMGFLKRRRLYDNTVIVIASDHGEEFWDHARFERERFVDRLDEDGLGYGVDHGHTMFCELLDVPLIFHGPRVPKAAVDTRVRNLDITPTLLGLAGIPVDGSRMQGVDLVSRLGSGTLEDMPAFSEDIAYGYEKKAYQDGRYKYVRYFAGADTEFLFDKLSDPAETADISKERPDVAMQMREKLDALVNGLDKPKGRPVAMDERTKDELRAVGYLQ